MRTFALINMSDKENAGMMTFWQLENFAMVTLFINENKLLERCEAFYFIDRENIVCSNKMAVVGFDVQK